MPDERRGGGEGRREDDEIQSVSVDEVGDDARDLLQAHGSGGGGKVGNARVGHAGDREEGGGMKGANYVSIGLQFIVAVLLAFIGFTLQSLHGDTATSLRIAQENQVVIGQLDSKLTDIGSRLNRLERTQDRRAP